MAREHGIPVYRGRIKTPEFERMFVEDWSPDLCLMATFGQLIPKRLFQVPRLGFYNFHHADDAWPSYPGPDPIAAMVRDGRTHLVLTIHKVTDVIDGGGSSHGPTRWGFPRGSTPSACTGSRGRRWDRSSAARSARCLRRRPVRQPFRP